MKIGKKAFGLLNWKTDTIWLMRNSRNMDSWFDDYLYMLKGEGIEG